ncbi:ABC-2 type transport system ATP-binding protein [Promicromonospora sp. AC04]|uniref:ABC transporter ATP-binding protein n=1 Tax=Promicromonospora sp. AC04 TaxID=2135723 RepID=UPI000D3D1CA5|nr:ABC transporter ATP-binding protein [Promicromonospora sp. AC04]PUB26142.1 ABC-2 type transport system ATP-binding protein [Promicromonospora sp. AC04]
MDETGVNDTSELVVRTDALTKRYGDRVAVDRVSMTVRRGEVYGFLGHNGAGKTTTLRMVLGLVRPTAGRATVLGRPAGRADVTGRVGALVEGPGFYPYLSGRDNLRSLARYRHLPRAEVERVLDLVDLTGRGDDAYKGYSLGMKQRLGVAAALLGDPELVILDEPTNGLDPTGMADMRELVVSLARDGRTVVLSSHLLTEVQEICDRVGIIDHGRLLREAAVADLRGGITVRVRATPRDTALAVASRLAGPDGVRPLPDGALGVDLPASAAPDLTRALVAAGADVHEVAPSERTLEEVFFEMTASAADPSTRATTNTAAAATRTKEPVS